MEKFAQKLHTHTLGKMYEKTTDCIRFGIERERDSHHVRYGDRVCMCTDDVCRAKLWRKTASRARSGNCYKRQALKFMYRGWHTCCWLLDKLKPFF